ncbi:MAG: HPP family protein [Gallionella sp.]|nr:HPP family protein [Gallionella sp.]MDD4946013.1 HPP family protein [Gallionella sp.]
MRDFWGIAPDTTGHGEKLISGVGGFIGILLTMWISHHYLGVQGAALLVASMGASAVLLFAVPHGPLSQPWALMGGHFFSALVGVSCAQLIVNPYVAAPVAVGLAITAMHYLRCTHPPGGATAITAVIGGAEVHKLGFQYVLTPVLANATLMLLAALVVNYFISSRRYPVGWKKPATPATPATEIPAMPDRLTHTDFDYALKELGTYVDVSEQELAKIYRLAVKHAWQLSDQTGQLDIGLYYSNGEQGADLVVRKVLELSNDGATVTFRVVAGDGQGAVETTTLTEFSIWQKYEVISKNGAWHRIWHV